jgi:Cof subfamily protein (haloacid dehalogenase superfamily)
MTGAAGPTGLGWPTQLPRVVATDLDGTLLRSDGSISARTREALAATEQAGTAVLFVTARPPRWVEPLADAVGPHGVVIAGNGAFLVDLARGEVTSSGCFAGADLLPLVADLRAEFPDAGFALERRAGMTVEATFTSPHGEDHDAASVVTSLDDVPDLDEDPTGKLLVVAPRGTGGPAFIAAVQGVVADRGHVAYSGVARLAEISAPGTTKAAGLAAWCSARGIGAADVWAFGDMPNDLPMLQWAGTSFGVEGGHPDVIALTTHTCPANDADGVASVLEHALANRRTRR